MKKHYKLMDCVREGRLLDHRACPDCFHYTNRSAYGHCESLIVAIAAQSLGDCTQEEVAELLGRPVRWVANVEARVLTKLEKKRAMREIREAADNGARREPFPPMPIDEDEPATEEAGNPAQPKLLAVGEPTEDDRRAGSKRHLPIVREDESQQLGFAAFGAEAAA